MDLFGFRHKVCCLGHVVPGVGLRGPGGLRKRNGASVGCDVRTGASWWQARDRGWVSLSRKLYEKQPFRFSCSGKTHRSLSAQNAVLPPPHRVGRPLIRASPRDDCLFARRIQSFRVANAIFSHGDYYLIARPKLRLGGAKRAFCSEERKVCLCKLLIINWLVNCSILGVYALTVFFFQNNRGTRRFFSRFFMGFFPVGTNGRRGGSMGVCTAEGSMATVYGHGGGHGVMGRCA